MPIKTSSDPDDSQKQKSTNDTSTNNLGSLTYKQQLKQDAMLWAEFLYSEYKREKALLEEVQPKPTHHDNPNT